jgi:formylglycine-generating enzyme required for sulfatase activity
MRKLSTALFAATALALVTSVLTLPQVQAQSIPPMQPPRALEEVVESTSDDVLLPTSVPGTITFRNCSEPCAVRSLTVTTQSTFFVGKTPVALADFNAFLRSGGTRPVTVLRELNGTNVTRVVVIGDIGQLKQTTPARQIKRTR